MKPLVVAYVSSYGYAAGAANDTRTNGLIRSIELAGHSVSQPAAGSMRSANRAQSWIARVPVLRTFGMGSGVADWLSSLIPVPDVVYVYGADPRFLRPARKWARAHDVPIIVEVVDWYEIRDGATLGQKLFTGLINLWSMPREASRCDAAVVASAALADYFGERGLTRLRIPAIMDAAVPARPDPYSTSNDIRLVYAGTPGRRDRKTLENISRLPDSARLAGLRIQVDVIGVSSPEPSASHSESTVMLHYHGRMPREDVLAITAAADFSILQRDPARRFARAGFPSKIAESLMLGTPVMSNLSSDLSEYLDNEGNAIVLASDSYDALVDGVLRAATWLESTEPDRVKIASDAADAFSPDAYTEGLSDLLHSVAARRRL